MPPFALFCSGLRLRCSFQPEILGMFVYTILLIMWLKFLVIWRLFRFWALCDGVEPPENMQVGERLLFRSIAALLVQHGVGEIEDGKKGRHLRRNAAAAGERSGVGREIRCRILTS